ncbi:MAG: hypothetical protein ACERKD_06530 [Prolixibacteraceae bacterium]
MKNLFYTFILFSAVLLVSCEKEQLNSSDLKSEKENPDAIVNKNFDETLIGNCPIPPMHLWSLIKIM